MARQAAEVVQVSGVPAGPSRDEAHRMFDRISHRYDLLNRLLSLGIDSYWRKRLVGRLPRVNPLKLLDLATGTADVALTASGKRKDCFVVGVDKSEEMLKLAGTKIESKRGQGTVTIARGDGLSIPLVSGSVDAVTIAFGIRNMPDTTACLKEMLRLLRPNGKALVLEFSLPQNPILRKLHLFYLRTIVPGIGRLISGDDFAYRYLNKTVETYLHGKEFCLLMEEAGFLQVRAIPLTFGIVTIYEGTKA